MPDNITLAWIVTYIGLVKIMMTHHLFISNIVHKKYMCITKLLYHTEKFGVMVKSSFILIHHRLSRFRPPQKNFRYLCSCSFAAIPVTLSYINGIFIYRGGLPICSFFYVIYFWHYFQCLIVTVWSLLNSSLKIF